MICRPGKLGTGWLTGDGDRSCVYYRGVILLPTFQERNYSPISEHDGARHSLLSCPVARFLRSTVPRFSPVAWSLLKVSSVNALNPKEMQNAQLSTKDPRFASSAFADLGTKILLVRRVNARLVRPDSEAPRPIKSLCSATVPKSLGDRSSRFCQCHPGTALSCNHRWAVANLRTDTG